MDKYKDFRDLKDSDKTTLMDLFTKRNYSDRIDNPNANDIIIIDDPWDGFSKIAGEPHTAKKEYTEISTYEERMKLKETSKFRMYKFPETNSIDCAKFELKFLNPLEIEDYYVRKRVVAYLNICKKIVRDDSDISKHTTMSFVYSFVLIEAYYRGESGIRDMKKDAFLEYVAAMFPGTSSSSICQIVRTSSKMKHQYLNSKDLYEKLKEEHPSEYKHAMRIFPEYYPDLGLK